MRVYAGSDPLTGKRHDLTEVVPPGPRAAAEAEKVRTRLLNQVDEQRNPRTKATVNQLLDRYLAVVELEESTRKTYVGYLDVHVRPMLGALPLSKLNGEVLDTFYAELRRCRVHCDRRRRGSGPPDEGRARVRRAMPAARLPAAGGVHRPPDPLDPLRAPWSVRCAGAGSPSARRAARSRLRRRRRSRRRPRRRRRRGCSRRRGRTQAWGTFVWLAMTAGARRGELCALRRRHARPGARPCSRSRRASAGRRGDAREGHEDAPEAQGRARREHRRRPAGAPAPGRTSEAAELGLKLARPSRSCSRSTPTVRGRWCRTRSLSGSTAWSTRLGINTTLHKLRHYNATELIAAGVDLPHRGRPTRSRRRGHHDAEGLRRVGQRSRPPGRRHSRLPSPGPSKEQDRELPSPQDSAYGVLGR